MSTSTRTAAAAHQPSGVSCSCGANSAPGSCPGCRSKQPQLRRKAANTAWASSIPPSVDQALSSSGQPLEAGTRAQMEGRFHHDFSGVRIHADTAAARSAAEVNAYAYTAGRQVVFGQDHFSPHTPQGASLLAHELAHVVQNDRGGIPSREISQPHDAPEQEADRAAAQVLSGGSARVEGKAGAALQTLSKDAGIGLGIGLGVVGAAGLGLGIAALLGAFSSDKKKTDDPAAKGKDQPAADPDADLNQPQISYEEALKQGAEVLEPAFGTTYGERAGVDPYDGYDASEWEEVQDTAEKGGRHYIQPKIASSWIAMGHMFKNFGKDVPKAGGGMTKWRFDCFEFVEVLHLYARWRSMSRKDFESSFPKPRLGFFSNFSGEWESPFKADKAGQRPYKDGEMTPQFVIPKIPAGKSWAQVLDQAPVGSQIIWTNADAVAKCTKNPGLDFCGYMNENATKLGPDQYSAHPFGGSKSEKEIVQAMAEAVVSPVPPGYIKKNIYISAIRYSKAAVTGQAEDRSDAP